MTATASPPPWPRRSSGPSPATIPCPGTKRGIDEVLACFAALDSVGFKAETFFLQAGDDYVVDLHRDYSRGGDGKVDTTWALVWHLDAAGKVDRSSISPATSTRWTRSSGRTSRSSRYRSGL
jgi:hypothetical protein